MVETDRTTIQPIFFPNLRVSLMHPETKKFQNMFCRLVMNRRFHFHPPLVRAVQTWVLQGKHCGMIAMPAESQLPPLGTETAIVVEEFVALKAVGVRFRTQLEQAPTHHADICHSIFLFALNAYTADLLFKLPGQVFLKFLSGHASFVVCRYGSCYVLSLNNEDQH